MSSALGLTRPDKLSIWPLDDDGFGIDVVWSGPAGSGAFAYTSPPGETEAVTRLR
ncbi:hypothetical protein BH20ACT19_BH20ACT19_02720 [soil metagenome]